MMKKFFLLIFTFFLTVQVNAQLKAKLAAKHFENLAYFEAAPMYNELADKFLAKQKGEKNYVLRAVISNGKIVEYRRSNKYYRSEEHTSELQSRPHLVCRLLLEKKK